jgi:hypothetical protein
MERITTSKAIGAALFGWANQAFEVYFGPFIVAFMAALARMVYSAEGASVRQFMTVWPISAFVAFVVLHLLQWQHVDKDLAVALWGASAFLGKEICDSAVYVAKKSGALALERLKNVR